MTGNFSLAVLTTNTIAIMELKSLYKKSNTSLENDFKTALETRKETAENNSDIGFNFKEELAREPIIKTEEDPLNHYVQNQI